MAVDLPPGTWTAALIGPWWPAPSTALRAGAQHWSEACAEQQLYSQSLRTQWTLFAAHNLGHTADDLVHRFRQGEKFHMDLAEKYQIKASAFNSAADATDYLRSRLTDIADSGNKEINDILASKKLPPQKLAEIQAVQARCNADGANASRDAIDKMMAATQKSSTLTVPAAMLGVGHAQTASTPTTLRHLPRSAKATLNPPLVVLAAKAAAKAVRVVPGQHGR